jgi:hypothetical protein
MLATWLFSILFASDILRVQTHCFSVIIVHVVVVVVVIVIVRLLNTCLSFFREKDPFRSCNR